jgi:hypothetical protein
MRVEPTRKTLRTLDRDTFDERQRLSAEISNLYERQAAFNSF